MTSLKISRTLNQYNLKFSTSREKGLNNFQFRNNPGKLSILSHSTWIKKKAFFCVAALSKILRLKMISNMSFCETHLTRHIPGPLLQLSLINILIEVYQINIMSSEINLLWTTTEPKFHNNPWGTSTIIGNKTPQNSWNLLTCNSLFCLINTITHVIILIKKGQRIFQQDYFTLVKWRSTSIITRYLSEICYIHIQNLFFYLDIFSFLSSFFYCAYSPEQDSLNLASVWIVSQETS